ncbi:hypothetical protein [Nannocystis pusilla]|uniref:hypothetical protein n=1 Tax=Nannocystis pusilla TaxID=889268 RepID=UPI003B82899A
MVPGALQGQRRPAPQRRVACGVRDRDRVGSNRHPATVHRADRGRVQPGAHIAWWLATTGRVDRVVAMSGALPASFKPPRPSRPVRVEAVHGMRDPVIPYSAGEATARAFQAAGYPVRMTTLRLAGHGLSSMGAALAPALERALNNSAAGLATKSSSLGAR